MKSKLTRVRSFLSEKKADWILLTDSVEVRYLTGLKSSNMQLLVSSDEAHLFTDFRYKQMAEGFCSDTEWQFHELSKDSPKPSSFIPAGATVAIQSNLMSLDQYELLVDECDADSFLRVGKEISSLFSVKEADEISSVEKAAAIADSALAEWITTLYSGISERDAADLLEQLCRKEGSEGPSFDTIVLFGERSALPHGVPGKERMLSGGDAVLVDFGCLVNGYCSDMTRTFFWGEPSENEIERYNTTLKAQKAGVCAVKAGIAASDVDNIVRDIIKSAGYGDFFGHGTGHGVGLRIHESPALNASDDTILKPGMIVTVEPGIYIPDESGVRIEDLLLVTEDGCKTLSKSPKNLSVVPIVHKKK